MTVAMAVIGVAMVTAMPMVVMGIGDCDRFAEVDQRSAGPRKLHRCASRDNQRKAKPDREATHGGRGS